MLKAWEQKHPNQIMVITYEQNLRQGGARNIGRRYASADIVGFVDADDWIEKDMYEILYQELTSGNLDAVACKFVRDKGTCDTILSKGECGGIWTHLYRKSIILDNNVFFPEGLSYEDNYWGEILNLYIKKSKTIDKILYHYFVNSDSTVTRRNDIRHLDRNVKGNH